MTPAGTSVYSGFVWSPDSRFLWFATKDGIFQTDREGGPVELITKPEPWNLSDRNERFLLYTQAEPKTLADIWYVPIESGKPSTAAVEIAGTDAKETHAELSPDGNWLAYRSEQAGRREVYIRSFPMGSRVRPVSGADPDRSLNAFEPRWSPDGKQRYFLTGNPLGLVTLMAVAVDPDGHGGLRIGSPRGLFQFPAAINIVVANAFSYSPHPDGKRFLVNARAGAAEPVVNVITNWQKATR